MLAII